MDYIFLIYRDESRTFPPEEKARGMAVQRAVIEETGRRGILKGVSPLEPTSAAITIRVAENGLTTSTDGPFAETKEALAGFYILDCKDPVEAKYWASRIMEGACGRALEIRPLRPFPATADQAPAPPEAAVANG